MKLLTLTFISILISSLYASEAVQIDMHGGKESKTPSHFIKKTESMKDMLQVPEHNTSK